MVSLPSGHTTLRASARTSPKNLDTVIILIAQPLPCAHSVKTGRRGGTRTHSTRFWRPVLYQLSYSPNQTKFKPFLLYEGCVCDKNYNIFSKPTFQSLYVYSYPLCNYGAYTLHTPKTTVHAYSTPATTKRQQYKLPPLMPFILLYSLISVTTPAPTVRPPSRIAKRSSLSIAIGVINSTSIATLSPGITISVPSGKVTAPVTSVVRK